MRGELTFRFLGILKDTMLSAGDLIEVFLTAGYGTSNLFREASAVERRRESKRIEEQMRRRYHVLISNLKRDGLVAIADRDHILKLTPKGKQRMNILRKLIKHPLPPVKYPKKDSGSITIITYDIPEKEKRKREWLRAVLKNLGFKMIQKSVWFGKVELPRELLDDLVKQRLIEAVEIFAINKTGSLTHIL